MTRLLRPFGWLCASIVALGGFAWLGSMSPQRRCACPIRPDGWTSSRRRMPWSSWRGALGSSSRRTSRSLRCSRCSASLPGPFVRSRSPGCCTSITGAIAVPALRRRIAGASMSAILAVSAGAASLGGRALASAPTVRTVGTPSQFAAASQVSLLPAGVAASDVVGFGLDDAASVAAPANAVRIVARKGDTIWALAVAQYGGCTPEIVDVVAAASGVTDPALIFVGQTLVFPALDSPSAHDAIGLTGPNRSGLADPCARAR